MMYVFIKLAKIDSEGGSETDTQPAPARAGLPNDLRRDYRTAYEYHTTHYPPIVSAAYWQRHSPADSDPPEIEVRYWSQAAADMAAAAAGGGAFLTELLYAAYTQLQEEYKAQRAAITQEGKGR